MLEGASQLAEYRHIDRSHRQWCKGCGGHVMTFHPQWGLVDVYAATIPDFPFEPHLHVHYASAVLRIKGWAAQDERPAEGDGRLGRNVARVGAHALAVLRPAH